MVRLWFVTLDTARLRLRLCGAPALAALRALAPAANATGVRVLDACVIPCGLRAIIRARSPDSVRAFIRRFVAAAAREQPDALVAWRPAARLVPIPETSAGAWQAFVRRCRAAFEEDSEMKMKSRGARKGTSFVRVIDGVLDAKLGADECAARLRRYVADHDAPADEATAFGRLCEVVFAQGIGYPIVLAKRLELVTAFEGFDPQKVSAFDDDAVRQLLGRPIIRNESKIRACIDNARRWCKVAAEEGSYLGRVARVAAGDDAQAGWPALVQLVADDFSRINEIASRQTLKRWGFFTAFAHPGARRVIERLELVNDDAPAAGQLVIGSLARALGRDPYAVEGALSLFAALGPCRPEPRCSICALSDRCATGRQILAAQKLAV